MSSCILLAACHASGPNTGGNQRSVINGNPYGHPAIVYLSIQGGNCSGTFIGRQLILTARHCVIDFVKSNPDPWVNIEAWDGNKAGTGNKYVVSSASHIHMLSIDPVADVEDIALLETDEPFKDAPLPLAQDSNRPTPSNISGLTADVAKIVGFSTNGTWGNPTRDAGPGDGGIMNPDKQRLEGQMRITGEDETIFYTLEVDPAINQHIYFGDSGGPVLKNGEVIGVISGFTDGYGIGGQQSGTEYECPTVSPLDPFECLARIAFLKDTLFSAADPDQDGVGNAIDNCDNDKNAEQHNCDAVDELPGQEKGDACDMDPCAYVAGVSPVTSKAIGNNISVWWPVTYANIKYRAVGYSQRWNWVKEDMDGYYCACHDPNDTTPKSPTKYGPSTCTRFHCKQDQNVSTDFLQDTGWLRLNWGHYQDDITFSRTNWTDCPLTNNDSDGADNDCNTPLQARLYRRPFSDTGLPADMGAKYGDWQQYWAGRGDRTRYFRWDWRREDYPHPDTQPWFPFMNDAQVRIWLRRPNHTYASSNPNSYSPVFEFISVGKLLVEALRLLYPWEKLHIPSPFDRLGPFDVNPEAGPLLVHPLDLSRPQDDPDLQPYYWDPMPDDSAIRGLVIKRFNHKSGDFTSIRRSEVVEGQAVNTRSFAITRWAESDELYLFGGRSQSGELPSSLWRATPAQVGEETVYQWRQLPGSHPQGRTGAILVADPPRNRVLLLFGRTAEESSAEVFAYDRGSASWSSVPANVPDLAPVDSAGYVLSSDALCVYGGRRDDTELEGLYMIDLASLSGSRVDEGSPGGPGPRVGTALYHDLEAQVVYLFGGSAGGESFNDIWSFDLKRKTWSRVSAHGAPGAPPAMERAGLVVSSTDGAVSVLSGPLEEGPREPMWQLWAGGWNTQVDLQQPKPD